jgi:mannitol/fructose-specific phosphotransferase system IIA component (Ntr-type)
MALADLLSTECVLLDAPAAAKEELIRSLVDHLVLAGHVRSAAPVVRALLDREAVMSTGVGGGIGLPHAQSPAVNGFAIALARPREPIDFAALDGHPVGLVFLIVGPEDRTGLMRVLTQLSGLLHSGELQKRLLKAKTAEEALRAVRAEEAKHKS